MTAIADALKAAGYAVEQDQMYLAAAEALRHCGGDVEAAMRYFRGFIDLVQRDMKFGSSADGGQKPDARFGRDQIAADSSRGVGHPAHVRDHMTAAPPRDLAAKRTANLKVASVTVSAFSDFHTRYGLDLRRTQKHELLKLAKKHGVIARVAEAIERYCPNADPFAYVPDIIKPSDLELFIRQAEAKNDE